MTRQAQQSRDLVLKEIMQSQNMTRTRARLILKELGNLVCFSFLTLVSFF